MWRLMKRWHGGRRKYVESEGWVMDGWMKGAVLVGGEVGVEMRREEGAERLILWHHIGSYKLREWSPLHWRGSVLEAGSTEEEEEAAAAASQTCSSSPFSCAWPLTLWTRSLLSWSSVLIFGGFCSFSSSRCRLSWRVCSSSASHVGDFVQVSPRALPTGPQLWFCDLFRLLSTLFKVTK